MLRIFFTFLFALFLSGCASFKAERVDSKKLDEKAMEVTDEWVDGDTMRVMDETLVALYDHKRFKNYSQKHGKEIKLFVGKINNNTSEAYFPVEDLEAALLEKLSNSDKFILIDAAQRNAILKEITYQNDGNVDPAQAKSIGKQSGADALIFGDINMKPYRREGTTVKTYTVNLRLTDLTTAEEIARTRAKINKVSEHGGSGW